MGHLSGQNAKDRYIAKLVIDCTYNISSVLFRDLE